MSKTKLRSGTSSTATKGLDSFPLNVEDLCRILEASSKSGVSELKFGPLLVKFGPSPEQIQRFLDQQQPTHPSPPVAALTEAQHTKQTQESLEQAEIALRQEQLQLAMVEDPELFEQMLSDGDLSDDGALDGTDDGDDE
jgi:hypothetical protein